MAPVELEFSLNGKPKEKVVAEDGEIAVLDTPVGKAFAKLQPPEKIRLLRSSVSERLGTKFPLDPPFIPYHTRMDGLHYKPSPRKELRKAPIIVRVKRYTTPEGELVIEATGYDSEQPKT